jgi:hypothetical protein
MIEFLLLVMVLALAWHWANATEQAQRVTLLNGQLKPYRIEQRMQTLTDGYLRVLGDVNAASAEAQWAELALNERRLLEELVAFQAGLAEVWGEKLRVSRLPFALPRATLLFPQAAFDLRQVLDIHIRGLRGVMDNAQGLSPRDRAFTLTAEMLLLQHTCLWFCRTQNRASAHLLLRHRTSHVQVVQSVSQLTRQAYCKLVGCRL